MTQENGLLPCPFCGGEPKIEPRNPERDGDDWTRLACSHKDGTSSCASASAYGENHKERAIKAWNTRTPVIPAAEIDEALEAIEELEKWHGDCGIINKIRSVLQKIKGNKNDETA